jgi:hypothetical protein
VTVYPQKKTAHVCGLYFAKNSLVVYSAFVSTVKDEEMESEVQTEFESNDSTSGLGKNIQSIVIIGMLILILLVMMYVDFVGETSPVHTLL